MPDRHVFISHASRDAPAAHAIVAALEAGGVACWISARNVAPGENFQKAIVTAIRAGRAMVVLVSEAANASDEVKKELALASTAGVPVYPVRLDAAAPNAALSYELATRQWIEGDGDPQAVAAKLLASLRAMPPVPAPQASLKLPDLPSIAVLPFTNLGGDPEQEYFSDGVAEDILTDLSRDRRLFVIGRGSSFSYRGRSVDLRQVGRDLGIRYVLDGSVRRAGDRLRITARLNNATTGASVWAERYDRGTADMLRCRTRSPRPSPPPSASPSRMPNATARGASHRTPSAPGNPTSVASGTSRTSPKWRPRRRSASCDAPPNWTRGSERPGTHGHSPFSCWSVGLAQ